MSSSQNKIVYLILLFILGGYLGHAVGRADRQDAIQQKQIEQSKEVAK